jgi:succinate dehydrogenase / fumarate reductase cytochrome b subunit
MSEQSRPLSPHLLIYRPQLTSILSFFHRMTGILLSLGVVMLTFWLVTAAAGEAYYAWAEWFLSSWLGYALLAGWSFCLFYHLCNGIRHLCWDMGLGTELRTIYASGYVMVAASFGLTALAWALGLLFGLEGGT